MPSNAYTNHMEASITTAEPVELIRLLYREALSAVRDAGACLASGQIPERSHAISKATEILRELTSSLNHQIDPAISRNLLELYDYMQRRLLAAHLEQSNIAIEEVSRLLTTMSDAWERMNPLAPKANLTTPHLSEPAGRIGARA